MQCPLRPCVPFDAVAIAIERLDLSHFRHSSDWDEPIIGKPIIG
jgi:hypothetical protein